MSKVLKGKSICNGVVIGRVRFHGKKETVKKLQVKDCEAEILRFEDAGKRAGEQLEALYKKLLTEVGVESAGIFEGQLMILEDENYHNWVIQLITEQKVNAEYAVDMAGKYFA